MFLKDKNVEFDLEFLFIRVLQLGQGEISILLLELVRSTEGMTSRALQVKWKEKLKKKLKDMPKFSKLAIKN